MPQVPRSLRKAGTRDRIRPGFFYQVDIISPLRLYQINDKSKQVMIYSIFCTQRQHQQHQPRRYADDGLPLKRPARICAAAPPVRSAFIGTRVLSAQ
jgi:hypothetical protein